MQDFAARFRLPAATGFRRQDLFDNCHDSFVGDLGLGVNPFLAQRVRDADLIIAIGSRLSEATTSEYELVKIPRPVQKLIHVHADSHELGRVYQADLLVHSDMQGFADAIEHLAPDTQPAWGEWTDAARADYLDTLEHGPMVGRFDLGAMFDYLRIRVPADAILTNGAGNYASWLHRFYQYRGFRTQLAPASGAMGYGVPAAIAAKLECPDRLVICFAGDGCFLMNDQELATAKHLGLRIIFIVVNNGMYGTVRMVQEISYPRNVYGSDLANPDFAMIGQAYGFYNAIVERTEDFAQAFEAALAAPTSSVLELRVDPESISPRTSISALQRRKPLS
jgi:acetolactate synthase-1/2/3 large subunit